MHFDLFDEGDVLAARPTPLVEVRPQLGVQRHTSEQVIETFVLVQVLDAPVPQMGEVQVVEFMRKFDAPVVAETVIAVPKIPLDKTRRRLGDYSRPPQMAEQLLLLVQFLLQGFSPGQGLQRTVEQNSLASHFQVVVEAVVLVEVFKVFALDRIQQRTWSRTLIFQLVVVFTVFFQSWVLPHPVVCMTLRMRILQGFLALFPVWKKCEVGVRTRGRN